MPEQRQRTEGDRRALGSLMGPEPRRCDLAAVDREGPACGRPRRDRAFPQREHPRVRGPRPQHDVVQRRRAEAVVALVEEKEPGDRQPSVVRLQPLLAVGAPGLDLRRVVLRGRHPGRHRQHREHAEGGSAPPSDPISHRPRPFTNPRCAGTDQPMNRKIALTAITANPMRHVIALTSLLISASGSARLVSWRRRIRWWRRALRPPRLRRERYRRRLPSTPSSPHACRKPPPAS